MTPTNAGTLSASTAVTVVSLNSGSVISATSYTGAGKRGDFPNFDAASTGPRAVVRVRNTGTTDGMNPGTSRLEFGADVTLDATNASSAPGSTDNGNNVVQRGLFNDVAQFKVQIDAGKPSCRVKGAGGTVEVTSTTVVTAGSRYRIRCIRSAGLVEIKVTPISSTGVFGSTVTSSKPDTSGTLSFALATSLSVGGKLNPNGTIAASASDQFNGTIDNAILKIG